VHVRRAGVQVGDQRDAQAGKRGRPAREGELALAQATLYLALAPKSNAVYLAYEEAVEDVRARPAEPVPLHIRNAPTGLMKAAGYGKGYRYVHDDPAAKEEMNCLPEKLRDREYVKDE
jgi:putative ATPase